MPDQTINQLPEKIFPEDNDLLILEDTQVGQTTKIKASAFGGRKRLQENTTFYVDKATGDDTNTGLSNQQSWKTLVYSLREIEKLDLNGYRVILEIKSNNYVSEGTLHLPLLTGGASKPVILLEGPSPTIDNTQLTIKTQPDTNGEVLQPSILPAIKINHFGYYSIEDCVIQYVGSLSGPPELPIFP